MALLLESSSTQAKLRRRFAFSGAPYLKKN
jgi:hypothetical protein